MATKEKIVEEAEEDEGAAAVDPEAAAKKKKLIMLGGIGVVLLLLAGGGTWFALGLLSDKPATEEAANADAEHEAEKARPKKRMTPAKNWPYMRRSILRFSRITRSAVVNVICKYRWPH